MEAIYDHEVPTIMWKQFLEPSVLKIYFQVPTILSKLISRSQYFYKIVTECSFPSNLVLELLEFAEQLSQSITYILYIINSMVIGQLCLAKIIKT